MSITIPNRHLLVLINDQLFISQFSKGVNGLIGAIGAPLGDYFLGNILERFSKRKFQKRHYKKSWFFKRFNLIKMSTLTKRMFILTKGMGYERHMVLLVGSFD
jgi:hypothetical protein